MVRHPGVRIVIGNYATGLATGVAADPAGTRNTWQSTVVPSTYSSTPSPSAFMVSRTGSEPASPHTIAATSNSSPAPARIDSVPPGTPSIQSSGARFGVPTLPVVCMYPAPFVTIAAVPTIGAWQVSARASNGASMAVPSGQAWKVRLMPGSVGTTGLASMPVGKLNAWQARVEPGSILFMNAW